MSVRVSELARLDFKAVVPVPASHTLRYITANRESAGLPLLDDVTVLVEHQPGIVEELGAASAQIDPASARRGYGVAVKAHEQRMLEDLHVMHRCLEQHLERSADRLR